jgi:integrase
MTFKRYAMDWIESYSGRSNDGVSAATLSSYADVINRIAIPFFGNAKLDQISPRLIKEYVAHLGSRGLAPATVRRYFAPVRIVFASAYEEDLLPRNPCAGLLAVIPGSSQSSRARPKRLTAEQTVQLIDAMPSEHEDLVYLLASTGVRISEALGVKWRNLITDGGGRPMLQIERAKTRAGVRRVPVTPAMSRRLLLRRAITDFADQSDPVFPNAVGQHIDPRNFRRRIFIPAAIEAGVPWARPHALRHGLASMMAREGHSPGRIAAQLGHADGGVLALKTYIESEAIESTEFVDIALSGSDKQQ